MSKSWRQILMWLEVPCWHDGACWLGLLRRPHWQCRWTGRKLTGWSCWLFWQLSQPAAPCWSGGGVSWLDPLGLTVVADDQDWLDHGYGHCNSRVSQLEDFFVRKLSSIPYIVGNHPSQTDFWLGLPQDCAFCLQPSIRSPRNQNSWPDFSTLQCNSITWQSMLNIKN